MLAPPSPRAARLRRAAAARARARRSDAEAAEHDLRLAGAYVLHHAQQMHGGVAAVVIHATGDIHIETEAPQIAGNPAPKGRAVPESCPLPRS